MTWLTEMKIKSEKEDRDNFPYVTISPNRLLALLAVVQAIKELDLDVDDCDAHDGWCENDGKPCLEQQFRQELKQALTHLDTLERL